MYLKILCHVSKDTFLELFWPLNRLSFPCTSTIKINEFILYCLRFALSLDKISCISTIKTNKFVLYCLRFALSLDKISCTSTIKINKFILYCLRFALSLQQNILPTEHEQQKFFDDGSAHRSDDDGKGAEEPRCLCGPFYWNHEF